VHVKKLQKKLYFLLCMLKTYYCLEIDMIKITKQYRSSTFEMKNMGEVRYVLGMEIIRNQSKKLLGLS